MRAVLAIVFSFLLSAPVCAKTNNNPTSISNAKVRFYSPQEIRTMWTLVQFTAHKGDRCFGSKNLFPLGTHGARNRKISDIDIGMLKDPDKSYASRHYFEIAVPSGTKFVFSAQGFLGPDRCLIRASFVPLENMEYEVTYSSNATSCQIRIDLIQLHDGKFMRSTEQSTVKAEPPCSKL